MNNLSSVKEYRPSWMKAPAAAAASSTTTAAPSTATAPSSVTTAPPKPSMPSVPSKSAFGVTNTSTNSHNQHYSPPHTHAASPGIGRPPAPPSYASPNHLSAVSPGLAGRSPLIKRLPTRMSPAIVARSMNPNAVEFVPRGAPGMSAGGLELLPASTADVEEEEAAASHGRAGSARNSPGYSYAKVGLPLQVSEQDAKAILSRSNLKVSAVAYQPRRTMNRVVLSKPTPLSLVPLADPTSAEAKKRAEEAEDVDEERKLQMLLDDLWCLFYLPNVFGEHIKEDTYNPTLVFRIDSIPTFWKVFNNVPPPTDMRLSTLYLFRDGINPAWEDPANCDGGIIKIKMDSKRVDAAWELLVCKTIGDSWSPKARNTVNGVSLKVKDRGIFLLEIWVTEQNADLMKDLAELLHDAIGEVFTTTYFTHKAMQERAQTIALKNAEKEKKARRGPGRR